MRTAQELIRKVVANGGQLRVEDGWLVIAPEDAATPVLEELRQHKAEIIGLLESTCILPDDPAVWRKSFARWLESTCVRHPRCFGGVGCLHIAFCKWESGRGGVPCSRNTFERLLVESGFLTGEVAGVVLVSGLTFREDFEVYQCPPAGRNSPSAQW